MTSFKPLLIAGVLVLAGAGCRAPATRMLDVPFTSQAPDGDWGEPWQNACEETSIAMVDAYYSGEASLAPRKAAEDILRIFNIKNDRLGPSADESVGTMARMVGELGLDWSARAVSDPTVEALEAEIDAGRPVIVPVYAPVLYNKTYELGDVDYHAVVLIGYDRARREFVVNDPGRATGKGVRFGYDLVMEAMHDLNQENYRAGAKTVLFTEGTLPLHAL